MTSLSSAQERGNRALNSRQFETAVKEFDDAIRFYVSDTHSLQLLAQLHTSRATAHLRMGNVVLAFEDAEQATKLDDNSAKSWVKFGEVLAVMGESKSGGNQKQVIEENDEETRKLYETSSECYENPLVLLQLETRDGAAQLKKDVQTKLDWLEKRINGM
ncbi:hypothetical protein C8J56DRAFT_1037573 [Mycena floridula]|nr:hypothetical protein C8J56DRAFT_1037573 [Mycena floridula]